MIASTFPSRQSICRSSRRRALISAIAAASVELCYDRRGRYVLMILASISMMIGDYVDSSTADSRHGVASGVPAAAFSLAGYFRLRQMPWLDCRHTIAPGLGARRACRHFGAFLGYRRLLCCVWRADRRDGRGAGCCYFPAWPAAARRVSQLSVSADRRFSRGRFCPRIGAVKARRDCRAIVWRWRRR